MTNIRDKFRHLDIESTKIHMTLAEAEQLSVALAEEIAKSRPDLIVGLANGALLPAHIVSDRLGLPVHIIRIRREGARLKGRLLAVVRKLPLLDALIRSKLLRRPFYALERAIFSKKYSRHEVESGTLGLNVGGKRVAIVDDCLVTGGSVRKVEGMLKAAGAQSVSVNVLCWADGRSTAEPAAYLHRSVHFYPWSGNSPDYRAYRDWLALRNIEEWE